MKNAYKIILSQVTYIALASVFAGWIGDYKGGGFFDIQANAFISFILLPFVYLFLIMLVSNFWFQKINKWSYLIPATLVLLGMGFLGYGSSNLPLVIEYWLIAFVGGWLLAQAINFVAKLIKK